MAYKPIIGFDGATPVLNYAGTAPVVMETPCPYSDGDWDDYPFNSTNTASTSFVKAVALTGGSMAGNQVFMRRIYDGNGTLNFTVTASSGVVGGVSIRAVVGGVDVGTLLVLATNGTASGTLPVPYYRYALRFSIGRTGTGSAGDWANVAITLS